jgi:hypothetical protein
MTVATRCHMHDISGSRSVHLPKRCPLCKGAVIERTSNVGSGTLIWLHCLFCNHWWKFRTDETRANPDGELSGQVFIVTKRGITYRLASVPVSAIPEEVAKKHLKSKTVQREFEIENLHRDIEGLTSTLQDTQADEHRLWNILQEDESNSQNSAAWVAVYKKTKKVTKKLEHLHSQLQQVTSDEYFYDGLPSGISRARTDADGRFSLVIPREGRYVIAARGPNEFRDAEPYWFVSVSLEGEPSKCLMLTNDNVLAARSEDCALL